MISISFKQSAVLSNNRRSDCLAGEGSRGKQNKITRPSRQLPKRQRAPLKRLCVGRRTGVRISFRRRQHQHFVFALGSSRKRAVPKAQITFPVLQIVVCLRNDGELLSRLVL